MQGLLRIVLGTLVLAFLIVTMLRVRRFRTLEGRLQNTCSPSGHRVIEQDETGGARGSLLALLLRLGFSFESFIGYLYLGVLPISVVLAIALVGWKTGASLCFGLAAGHIAAIKWRKNRRAREFADGLPGLLERSRRLILIGNTLPQAFVEAAATAEPVVKRQIDPVIRRIHYGVSFSDSIEMLAQQIDIIELHMLAAYVKTNAKFGGRVSETLVNLINQLRNRRRLEREIHAATAETRMSAAILLGLTALTISFLSVSNPDYLVFFLKDDTGMLILAAIICWPLIGVLVMRRILVVDF